MVQLMEMTSKLTETVTSALKEFKSRLEELYGERLVAVILYGSFARGEFSEGSDIDVAVILKGDFKVGEEIDRIGSIAAEIGLNYGVLLSTLPISEAWWNGRQSPLILNLRREGIRL